MRWGRRGRDVEGLAGCVAEGRCRLAESSLRSLAYERLHAAPEDSDFGRLRKELRTRPPLLLPSPAARPTHLGPLWI